MGVPRTRDGKPYMAPNIYPDPNYRYLTGRADNLSQPVLNLARGTGPMFEVDYDNVIHDANNNTTPLSFGFVDPVWIAGGGLVPWGAQFGDTCTLRIVAPATPVTPADGGNTGNCNLIDPGGFGQAVMLVPAANDGAYNVDLTTAVPIPYGDDWMDQSTGYCFWDWHDGDGNLPLLGNGVVAPNPNPYPNQTGRFNLFAMPLTLVTHANQVPMHGTNSQQNLTLAAIETKLVLPQWRFECYIHNHTNHAGLKASFWLDLGRAKT